jgi:hypothetical protein
VGATLVAVAIAYGWIAAGTRPFTVGADVLTAIPLSLAATWAVVGRSGVSWAPPAAATTRADAVRLWPWIAAIGLTALVELVAYFAGLGPHRYAYPTVSSLYDDLARFRAVKASLFAGWLALGWVIVCQ